MPSLPNINRDDLVDLTTVSINTDLPKVERLLDYKRQVHSPNCYKIGKYVICLSFSDNGPSAQEVFEDLARSKAGC